MKTREQLKAENDAEEAAALLEDESTDAPVGAEDESETALSDDEPNEGTTLAEGEVIEGGEEELEAWMQTEEPTSDGKAQFTSRDVASAKKKLRAKLEREHDSEVEDLKRQLSQATSSNPPKAQAMPARPKVEDYGFDSENPKYLEALDAWDDARIDAKVANLDHRRNQAANINAVEVNRNNAVDGHYQRAATLAAENNITDEVYKASDHAVRSMIEGVVPGAGDLVTDQIIEALGEGSEKTLLYVGRNKAALMELENALRADSSGMKALAVMGKLSAKATTPQKRRSTAPAPATQITGDGNGEGLTADAKNLKKKYDNAAKRGDMQASFDARRAAKKLGVAVSNW